MARAPLAGACKTRLQPRLGSAGCAELQRELIRQAANWFAGDLHVAVDGPAKLLEGLLPAGAHVFAQEGDDLGARMRHAAAAVSTRPLLIIGTDVPIIGQVHADTALAALAEGARTVLGPARDGGYWLAGLSGDAGPLFDLPADAWGGPEVLALTRELMPDAVVLEDLVECDVDTPADARLALDDPRTAPAVAATLRRTISVCVPTLQEAEQVGPLLDHLAALPGGWEVIVADGGSRDGTADQARHHPRADIVLDVRGGRAHQLNAAAAVSTGDPIVFLHADSRLPVDAHASLVASGADGGNFELDFDGGDRFSRVLGHVYALQRRLGFYYGDSTIWVRRGTWEALGGYRPLPIMDDYDLVRRLEQGHVTACLPGPATTAARRWQRQGLVRTLLSWWVIRWLYVAGVGPDRLARLYRHVR